MSAQTVYNLKVAKTRTYVLHGVCVVHNNSGYEDTFRKLLAERAAASEAMRNFSTAVEFEKAARRWTDLSRKIASLLVGPGGVINHIREIELRVAAGGQIPLHILSVRRDIIRSITESQ